MTWLPRWPPKSPHILWQNCPVASFAARWTASTCRLTTLSNLARSSPWTFLAWESTHVSRLWLVTPLSMCPRDQNLHPNHGQSLGKILLSRLVSKFLVVASPITLCVLLYHVSLFFISELQYWWNGPLVQGNSREDLNAPKINHRIVLEEKKKKYTL